MDTKKIDDGGPEISPAKPSDSWAGGPVQSMTLRDYFAGQALANLAGKSLSDALPNETNAEAVARNAYVFADALLRARKGAS